MPVKNTRYGRSVVTLSMSSSETSSVALAASLWPPAAFSAERYQRITVHGPTLEGTLDGDSADRPVSVWLPPGYEKNSRQRYPVIYLLHGFTDSDTRWFGREGNHFVNAPKAVDAAFAAGVKEAIVVMPNAFTKFQGSMYGNAVTTDACVSCRHASCGDGYVRAGAEQCDDGNASNGDACLTTCIAARCGDGVVQVGVETCDDGNASNGDACLNTCAAASCGDGYTFAGVEQCDDGNASSTDACLATCVLATCGDGIGTKAKPSAVFGTTWIDGLVMAVMLGLL